VTTTFEAHLDCIGFGVTALVSREVCDRQVILLNKLGDACSEVGRVATWESFACEDVSGAPFGAITSTNCISAVAKLNQVLAEFSQFDGISDPTFSCSTTE
jgi:hypothetical protein